MKTSIKTLFATALTALVLSSTAFTTFANDSTKIQTVKATNMKVNMVVVTGDVDVYLIHADKEDIKVIPFGNEKADVAIRKRGAKLYIDGATNQRATIYVYLKDLKRIDAANTAFVKTEGNFKLDALQIFLKDSAKAKVNVDAKSLYTVIKDHSSLKLSGTTEVHDSMKGEFATLKTQHFSADKTQAFKIATSYAAVKAIKK
jgi:hypothetical protein